MLGGIQEQIFMNFGYEDRKPSGSQPTMALEPVSPYKAPLSEQERRNDHVFQESWAFAILHCTVSKSLWT